MTTRSKSKVRKPSIHAKAAKFAETNGPLFLPPRHEALLEWIAYGYFRGYKACQRDAKKAGPK